MDSILYTGNAREQLKKLQDHSVDLILTDPPYNTGFVGKSDLGADHRKKEKLHGFFNDALSEWEYEKLMKDTFLECYRVLKKDKPMYVFIDWRNCDKLREWAIFAGFNFKQMLIWDKVVHGLNYQNYAYQYEIILFFTKGNYFPKRLMNKNDVLKFQRVNGDNEISHETVKPIPLISSMIKDNSEIGEVVLDPFAGSGTTLVAAQLTERKYIGIEKEQKYIDIITQRLANQAPQVKLNLTHYMKGGQTQL